MQVLSPVPAAVLGLIGNTPIQELTRLTHTLGLRGRIIAKLEHLNPGGSMKDRVALHIIRRARETGELQHGQPVLEVTSGNTGIGLAIVCRAMGHPFYAVMSRGNSPERAQMMRAFGAELVLVDQAPGGVPGRVSGQDMALVKEKAATLREQVGAYFANQFENPANPDAHFETTAPELWRQCDGKLDAVLAFAGTGGALGGMARFFHLVNPKPRTYAVEPECAASMAVACCIEAAHAIQGGGYGKALLPHVNPAHIHAYLKCSDGQALSAARLLAREEGILGGYSTGAHLHAAIELLKGPEQGGTIAFLVCDSGMKYLSTDLYP
ncbi:MAG: cysteine synthase family protein [Tepidisphaeraceae bacterium]